MKYRSDIDGLRALAILSVVIYHMFPKVLGGGFVGVDIFFVISGYLIGSTILKEYESGNFSFLKFYQRRFIRIIPLLLVVLITTLFAGYFILMPQEFSSLGRHVGAASTFISNFLLLKEIDYFNPAAELKPLLHLWSLGIEEQFYLVLPFLIFIFGKQEKRKKALLLLTILLLFIYSNYLLSIDQQKAFFRPESRFWQLLLGVYLSKLEIEEFVNNSFKKYYSVLGLILCLLGIFLFDGSNMYPGFRALIPTFGAMLIILSGPEGFLNSRLFSNPFFVFIGKISYSLYLWHWVLISFAHIIYSQNVPTAVMWIAVAISLVLSVITFYGVEKPLKHLSAGSKKIVTYGFLVTLVLVYLLGRSIYHNKIKQTHLPKEVKMLNEARIDSGNLRGYAASKDVEVIEFEGQDVYVRGKGENVLLFVGDSHLEHYIPRIFKLVSPDDPKNKVFFIGKPGCVILKNIHYVDPVKKSCNAYYSIIEDFIANHKINKFIISAHLNNTFIATIETYFKKDGEKIIVGSNPLADEIIVKELGELFSFAKKHGAQTYLVSSIAYGREFSPSSMFDRKNKKMIIPIFNKSVFMNKHAEYYKNIDKLKETYGVEVIDPIPFMCNESTCPVVDEKGIPIFSDDNHFRKSYSAEHVKYLDFLFK